MVRTRARRPNKLRKSRSGVHRRDDRIVSIPSRFENVLKSSDDSIRAFGSSSNRFGDGQQSRSSSFSEPGRHFKMSSFESKSTSFSAKGYGSGFISRSQRFKTAPPSTAALCTDCEDTLHPIHSSTFNDKHSRSTGFSTSRHSSHSAYFAHEIKKRAFAPGPGTYDHKKPNLNGDRFRRKRATSSFSSRSKRYFESIIDRIESQNQELMESAPAIQDDEDKENENEHSEQKQRKIAPFNSTASRFNLESDDTDNAVHRLLFRQSQHQNSRNLNRIQCQKAIVSTILRQKATLSDRPGPTKYFETNSKVIDAPAITSVFKSKTPKIVGLRRPNRGHRRERVSSSNEIAIKQRHHAHLDLNRL